jgi:hypothetical protein
MFLQEGTLEIIFQGPCFIELTLLNFYHCSLPPNNVSQTEEYALLLQTSEIQKSSEVQKQMERA